MKPPRILQVIHGDEAGGVKTLADALGETLRADGHVVDTVCLFPPHPAGVVGKLAGMARVGRLILTGRYDAVMAYQSTASVVAGSPAGSRGVPGASFTRPCCRAS